MRYKGEYSFTVMMGIFCILVICAKVLFCVKKKMAFIYSGVVTSSYQLRKEW